MKIFSVSLLATLLFAPTLSSAAPPNALVDVRQQQLRQIHLQIQEISANQLHDMQRKNQHFVLLDVREPNEYGLSISSINGVKIPRGLLEWRAAKALNVNDDIVVYCRTGDRGAYATQTLKNLGYRNVRNLAGGIVAWLEAGLPVETYLGKITPLHYRLPKK